MNGNSLFVRVVLLAPDVKIVAFVMRICEGSAI